MIIQADKLAALGLECFPSPVMTLTGIYYPPRRRFPGLTHLHVTKLDWSAMDDAKPTSPFRGLGAPTYYEHVKVSLDYEAVPFDPGSQPNPNDPLSFLQVSGNVAGSFLHGELIGAKDESDADIKSQNIPHIVPEVLVEWTLRWPMIPVAFFDNVLVPRMRARMGKVNSSASRVWKNAPAETMLFVGYDFQTEKTWSEYDGVTSSPVQCTMKFLEKNFTSGGKQVTHNHYWLPDKGWQKVKMADGTYSFETTDMDGIFY
jgi:hypothetical protein